MWKVLFEMLRIQILQDRLSLKAVRADAVEKISHILIRHYALRRRRDYDYDYEDNDIDDIAEPSSKD